MYNKNCGSVCTDRTLQNLGRLNFVYIFFPQICTATGHGTTFYVGRQRGLGLLPDSAVPVIRVSTQQVSRITL
jgi:hypothetical protein